MNGSAWKWIATASAGVILMLIGGVIQRVWSDRELFKRMDALERQMIQLTVTMSGDNGYGSRFADHEERLRALERDCLPD